MHGILTNSSYIPTSKHVVAADRKGLSTNPKRFAANEIFGGAVESQENRPVNNRVTKSQVLLSTNGAPDALKPGKALFADKRSNASHIDLSKGSTEPQQEKRATAATATKNMSHLNFSSVGMSSSDYAEPASHRGAVRGDVNKSRVFRNSLSPSAKTTRKAHIEPPAPKQVEHHTACTARKNASHLGNSGVGIGGTQEGRTFVSGSSVSAFHNQRNASSVFADVSTAAKIQIRPVTPADAAGYPTTARGDRGVLRPHQSKFATSGNILTWQ